MLHVQVRIEIFKQLKKFEVVCIKQLEFHCEIGKLITCVIQKGKLGILGGGGLHAH